MPTLNRANSALSTVCGVLAAAHVLLFAIGVSPVRADDDTPTTATVENAALDHESAEAAVSEAMRILQDQDLTYESKSEALKTLIELHPDEAELWAALGEVRVEANADEAALLCFERAVALDDTLYSSWHWIGLLKKREQRDLQGALVAFHRAMENGAPKAVQMNEIAVTLAQLGRMSDAYETWVKAIEEDPDWGVLHANALKAALALGDESGAWVHFQEGLEAERFEEQLVLVFGDYWVRQGEKDTAIEVYRSGIDRHPETQRTRYYYAMTLKETGEEEQAVAQLEKALELSSSENDVNTEFVAQKALFAIRHPNEMKEMEKAAELAYSVGKNEKRTKKNLNKAVEILDDLIEDHPKVWELNLIRGTAYRRLGDNAAARLDFERVLDSAPNQPNAMMNLALIFRDQKNYYSAVEKAWEAVEIAPRDLNILMNAGFVFLDAERCSEAREMLARAEQVLPDDVEGDPLAPLAEEIRSRCGDF